ncbi:MAG: hypothetical protein OEV69_12205 [Gammaproteobacteria bacterium]|nr:hypothetical protein [Gammaproteobacteria bacterium]MDH5323317.1 hypothetical protein [Gammaproteobacteria bacterium]
MRTIIINVRTLLAIWLLLTACAARAAHEYSFALDEKLSTMAVVARFDRAIDYVSARSSDAGRYLRDAEDCDRDVPLESSGRRLELPAAGIRCLSYTVSMDAAARDPGKIVISPALWMWRPRLARDDEILASFSLPGSNRVFVPWQMSDDSTSRYRLVASPESGMATAVFGQFQQRFVQTGGAQLRIVLLGQREDIELDRFLAWIRATAGNVQLPYGEFPVAHASVLLIPRSGRPRQADRPVSFGRVVRDGGATIELMINPDLPIADYFKEWTPTHEFSHLLLPYLDDGQRWISEGFAQYYQNVLLARAGQYSAQSAWQRINAGLERGRNSAPDLSPNEAADRDSRDTRMKVYWSGTALALMADVELRRRSAGRDSLDTVLGELKRCCLPSARTWSGIELFSKLDELLDEPVFMPLYRQHADARTFPDARPLLMKLGIIVEDDQVRLDDAAEFAAIRTVITRGVTLH